MSTWKESISLLRLFALGRFEFEVYGISADRC